MKTICAIRKFEIKTGTSTKPEWLLFVETAVILITGGGSGDFYGDKYNNVNYGNNYE